MEVKLKQNSSVTILDHNGNAVAVVGDNGDVKAGGKDVATKEYVDINAPISDLVFESIKFVSSLEDGNMRVNFPSSLTDKLARVADFGEQGDFLQGLCICFMSKPIHEKLLTEIENNRLVIRFDYPVDIRRNNGGAGRRSFCFEKQHYKEEKHKGLIYRVKMNDIKTNRFGEKYVEVIRPLNEFMTDIVLRQEQEVKFSYIDIESRLFRTLYDESHDGYNRPAWCKTLKHPVSIKPKTIGTNLNNHNVNGYYYVNDYDNYVGNYQIGFNYMNGDKPKTLLARYYQEVCFSLNIDNDLTESILTANNLSLRLKKHQNYGNEQYDTSTVVNGWYYFRQNKMQTGNPPHVLKGEIKRKNKFVVKPRFAILTEENIEDLPTRQSPIWKKTFPQSQQQIQIYMPSINIREEDYDLGLYSDYFAIAQVSITPL